MSSWHEVLQPIGNENKGEFVHSYEFKQLLEILLQLDQNFFMSINNTPTNPVAFGLGFLKVLKEFKIDVTHIRQVVEFGCGHAVPLAIMAAIMSQINDINHIKFIGYDIDNGIIEMARKFFDELIKKRVLPEGISYKFTSQKDDLNYQEGVDQEGLDIVFCYPQKGQMSRDFIQYIKAVLNNNPNAIIIVNCFTNSFGEDFLGGIELKLNTDERQLRGNIIEFDGEPVAGVIGYSSEKVTIEGDNTIPDKIPAEGQVNLLVLTSPNNPLYASYFA
ncbi:MAG: hypothetical protein KatS3mg086_065 [Candidatus Dojkabacteria bacterium]|nr:MAG: hypothetical protein KatS3mg086_065 [Candidatus Dojkabacteria bacterium]